MNVGHGLGPYKNTWLLRKCLGLGPFVCDKESGPTRTDGALLTRYCSGFFFISTFVPYFGHYHKYSVQTRKKCLSDSLCHILFFARKKLSRSLFVSVSLRRSRLIGAHLSHPCRRQRWSSSPQGPAIELSQS